MELKTIAVNKIAPNPYQPRLNLEDKSLQELAASIKERGILEPIIVKKQDNRYQLVAGERRLVAAKMLGLEEIPAIVRTTSEDDIVVESLMENLHRIDLTDIERESAIYKMWTSGRFKTKSEMAKALGLDSKKVLDDINSWEFRQRSKISQSIPTYIITRTNGLEEEVRKSVLMKFDREEFRAIDVYSVVKTIKKASDQLQKELLKPESSVSPKIAELIVERITNHSDQNLVVQAVNKDRLNAKEVQSLIARIQRRETTTPLEEIVSEIDTGILLKCPVCSQTYKIFHNTPTNTHSLREMS